MEEELQSLNHESLTQSPLKRKPDLVPAEEGDDERTMKQQKPDGPLEDEKGGANQNGNADKKKGKSILSAADKGKGKMVLAEEEGSDDEGGKKIGDSSDDEDGSSDVDDSDFSDDPLAEMDLDNILPVRTRRRRALEPGAYLVEGKDDDDDDDDDDDEEEDEEEEEENEEEEVEEEESK